MRAFFSIIGTLEIRFFIVISWMIKGPNCLIGITNSNKVDLKDNFINKIIVKNSNALQFLRFKMIRSPDLPKTALKRNYYAMPC
mgnify:CR=1 FL=1